MYDYTCNTVMCITSFNTDNSQELPKKKVRKPKATSKHRKTRVVFRQQRWRTRTYYDCLQFAS